MAERTGIEWAERQRIVDKLLEDELVGFYLSAPRGTPLNEVRRMLRDPLYVPTPEGAEHNEMPEVKS